MCNSFNSFNGCSWVLIIILILLATNSFGYGYTPAAYSNGGCNSCGCN